MSKGKLIVLSAPSGTGKSTIINELMKDSTLGLSFSVSATSRRPREGEKDGVNYYFLTQEEFERRIAADEFVEWAEVYAGTYYGTLASEIERITSSGRNVIMDIDVAGAENVKKMYGSRALTIFIEPPSLEVLKERLTGRGTDDADSIARRLGKAEYEMGFASAYDREIVNDSLDKAVSDVAEEIREFTRKEA